MSNDDTSDAAPERSRHRRAARVVLLVTGLFHAAVWVYLTVDGVRAVIDTYWASTAAATTARSAPQPAGAATAGEVPVYLLLVAAALASAAALRSNPTHTAATTHSSSVTGRPVHGAVALRFDRFSDGRGRIIGGGWGAVLLYFALIVVAQDFRIAVELATGAQAIPAPADRSIAEPARLAADVVTSIGAGVWEELALFALPIALLTRHGWHTRRHLCAIIAVAMVLRTGIHLYYGTGATMVIPWMIGAVLLYRAVGSIWPLVTAHAVFDLWVSAVNRLNLTAGPAQITQHLIVAAALALMWRSTRRARQHRRELTPHRPTQ